MQFILLLLVSIAIIQAQAVPESSPSSKMEEVEHVLFLKDKLFYLCSSGRAFGFISREAGQIMTEYQLKPQQAIINIDYKRGKMVLRRGRSQALVFKLQTLHVHEIDVNIAFRHQKLTDLVETDQKIYAMTQKDVRVYDIGSASKGQNSKNILASGRKKDWFHKIFLEESQQGATIILVFTKHRDLCIRKLTKARVTFQKCFQQLRFEITRVERIDGNLLIVTQNINNVFQQDGEFYSFFGNVTQLDRNYAVIGNEFRVINIKKKEFIDGLAVVGSKEGNQFWIVKRQLGHLWLNLNGEAIANIEDEQLPIRSWIDQNSQDEYTLLLQFRNNRLVMYEVRLGEGSLSLKWTYNKLEEKKSIIETDL